MAGFIKLGALLGLLLVVALSEGKIWKQKIGIPPAGPPNVRAKTPMWGNITQKVDHCNPNDSRTWEMRYMYNDQFFNSSGPMFVFLGGEWAISEGFLMAGQMFDMAAEHSGYMFYTEHRFYGESRPTADYSTDSLEFLSSKQALADLIFFIQYQKASIPGLADSKVIVVGGSYSASLATWARLKHPDVIDIAYASSAPLRAVVDFEEYQEVVNTDIGQVDSECLAIIKSGVAQTVALLDTPEGIANVSAAYQTCTTLRTDEPYKSYFFNNIAGMFAGIVQYSMPGDIDKACNYIKNASGTTDMDKLAAFIKSHLGGCIGDYDAMINYYSSTAPTTDSSRQWWHQTCAEFGFFQTTDSADQPFGDTVHLELFFKVCEDLFNQRFNNQSIYKNVDATNEYYGGLGLNLTRVITVHGTVDPWHALGALTDISSDAPSIVVTGTSHCADLGSVSPSDSPDMVAAKNKVRETIAAWIAN